MPTLTVPAAQYLRMSTDEQQLSFAYQAAAISEYAARNAFTVIKSYEDAGRSGLTLKHRQGLAQLLHDVVSGEHPFKAVLVYDITRWGRFQDTDEAAHYEFVCKSSGTPVYYCAESFQNNSSPPTAIMKTLKRVMAAEYSRELSERLSRTKKILTENGFRAGGLAGYGLRRMLVSADGSHKQILHKGEVKNVETGRVILVPGPPNEVARVKEIYRLKICEKKSIRAMVLDFNRRGLKCCGKPWNYDNVRDILRNRKYLGWAVWRQTTGPLGKRPVRVPEDQWIVNRKAFTPLIDQENYDRAQRVMNDRTRNKSNEQLLNALRKLLKKKGRISQSVMDRCKTLASASTYGHRFGGLRKAYALIGYKEFPNNQGQSRMVHRLRGVEFSMFARIVRALKNEVEMVRERPGRRRVIHLKNGIRMSLLICQCRRVPTGHRWVVKVNRFEKHLPTLVCRCTPNNRGVKDAYLMPCVDNSNVCNFRITESDPWLRMGKRISDLSELPRLATRIASAAHQKTEQS